MHLNHNTTDRAIDRWFSEYSSQHQNPTNRWIHTLAMPAMLWSVIALLWCVPVPGGWFRPGLWAGLAMFFAWMFYYRASRPLGYGMLALLVLLAWLTRWLYDMLGAQPLLYLAIGVLVVARIGQLVGRKFEGSPPSFLTDLTYVLIGPAWSMAKVYRQVGWRY